VKVQQLTVFPTFSQTFDDLYCAPPREASQPSGGFGEGRGKGRNLTDVEAV